MRILFLAGATAASSHVAALLRDGGLKAEPVTREAASSGISALDRDAARLLPLVIHEDEGTPAILRKMRRAGALNPVLVVGNPALSEPETLLDAGSDDVVELPVSAAEIGARLRAITRRVARGAPSEPVRVGALCVPMDNQEPRVNGRVLPLSPRELDILRLLASVHPQVLSRRSIHETLFGLSDPQPHLRVVDAHVHNLRRKIREMDPRGLGYVRTRAGVGYSLADE